MIKKIILRGYSKKFKGTQKLPAQKSASTFVKVLDAENENQDSTGAGVDFMSNGISIRTSSGLNGDGDYIYLAFAAEPLVANVGPSIPATAG